MILFQLRCGNDHQFEGWFRNNDSYDAQAAAGEITCPACGDTHVGKAIMAPRLNKATGQSLDVHDAAREFRRMLGELRSKVEANCDYVGDRFADEARKIHYGDSDARPIYGEATAEETRELADEGVDVQVIPWVAREN